MKNIWFHSQDLNKDPDRRKSGLINWRCWLKLFPEKKQHVEFKFSISAPSSFWHIDIDLCQNGWQEEAISFSVACPLFAVWFSVGNWWLYNLLEEVTRRRNQPFTHGRNIGISWHSGGLWIHLWEDQMESRLREDPWWWAIHIDFADLILGKAKYLKEDLGSGLTEIDMPEGKYPATYEKYRQTWKRPRWFKKVREGTYFELPVGIPHQGKGENSWDCGMDATYGTGSELRNIHQAAKDVALECLKDRSKYGSLFDPAYAKWREDGLAKIGQKPEYKQILDQNSEFKSAIGTDNKGANK